MKKIFWLLLLIVLLVNGCASSLSRRIPLNATPGEILTHISKNYRGLESFQGIGRLIINTPEVKFDAPALVLTKKPDSLFIKVEAIFGVDVGFFFADGARFESYSPIENTYFFGDIDQMQRLLLFQMEVTYEEIMSAIVGAVLPSYDSTSAIVNESDEIRFDGWRDEWQVSYWIDARRGVVTKAEQFDSTGTLYARQTFQRFRRFDDVWLPQLIRLDKPQQREYLTVFYSRVTINREIDRSQFSITVPISAERLNLSGSQMNSSGSSFDKDGSQNE